MAAVQPEYLNLEGLWQYLRQFVRQSPDNPISEEESAKRAILVQATLAEAEKVLVQRDQYLSEQRPPFCPARQLEKFRFACYLVRRWRSGHIDTTPTSKKKRGSLPCRPMKRRPLRVQKPGLQKLPPIDSFLCRTPEPGSFVTINTTPAPPLDQLSDFVSRHTRSMTSRR